MAKKANTLTRHVQALHRELGYALFLGYRTDRVTANQAKLFQRAIDQNKTGWLGTGASIAAFDLYADEPGLVAYSGVGVEGEDMLKLLDETNSMAQAVTLVTVYEAMEKYLKAVSAEYLYAKRGVIPVKNKHKQMLKERFGRKAERENTKPWFRQLVMIIARRNCEPLLRLLFKHVSGLKDRVTEFFMGNLEAAHQAVEFVRHLTTHGKGRYDEGEAKKLPKEARQALADSVKNSFLHKGEKWLLPSHKTASWLISRETEYAQVVYDSLTQELAMKLDYTPGHDPEEVGR